MACAVYAARNWRRAGRNPTGVPVQARMAPAGASRVVRSAQAPVITAREIPAAPAPPAPVPPAPMPRLEPSLAAAAPGLSGHRAGGADPLTGLPTQMAFAARLQTEIRQARSNGSSSSLLLINLQGRQKIIAQHGRNTGDKALCEITRRLQRMLKASEMLARLGEDEFAVIAEGMAEPKAHSDAASRLAAQMVETIRRPIPANDTELRFGANIGISLCRSGASAGADLLQGAASALQQAKGSANGFGLAPQWREATPGIPETLDQQLQRALAEGAILPFYQPVVNLAANRICGFEALARWQHPTRGFVPPDEFIPALERMGKMRELTETILTKVCRDAKAWPQAIHVAINVSPSELSDPLLPARMLRIAGQEGMTAGRLEVEITETALVNDIPAAKASLLAFREAGIVTALDDFGTGYSSLAQLRQLKFDRLKIDQTFVRGMLENGECEKIVDAILGLVRSLDLQAVAEGIETEALAASLASRGCEFGQGYYFSRPLTAQAAGAILKTGLSRSIAA